MHMNDERICHLNKIWLMEFATIQFFLIYGLSNLLATVQSILNTIVTSLLMQFIRNGTLGSIIKKVIAKKCRKNWTDTKKLINIYGIASAMPYLHSLGILHRDLSIWNVLVDRNFYPKLCDFGLSINMKDMDAEEKDDVMGMIELIAPEIS